MQNVNVYCLIFYLQKVNLHFAVFAPYPIFANLRVEDDVSLLF